MAQALKVVERQLEQLQLKILETAKINKDQIKEILFHTGIWLLLNSVQITPTKIIGTLTVREDMCAGHIIEGIPVFRGSDYLDMAAQLLGVCFGISAGESFKDMTIIPRRYGAIKFRRATIAGETILTEINRDQGVLTITGPTRGISTIICKRLTVMGKSSKKQKVQIADIQLSIIPKKSLSSLKLKTV